MKIRILVTVACAAFAMAAPPAAARAGAAPQSGAPGYRAACAPTPGQMRCFALYAPQTAVNRALAAGAAVAPRGWGARSIEAAYRLLVSRNPRQTVAVVDAYDTPNLASYLAAYRHQYGLPPCTAASGCFRKVNQNGKASPLAPNGVLSGWDLETTLDVDMVSAACPLCRILVVEANSPAFADLAAAENSAVRLGASVVSNSYGVRENGYAQSFASAYHHPGHAIVVATGDFGFTAANFPANLAFVTAVGGTELFRAKNRRGWTETVWNYGGGSASGCSAYVAKPSWQHDPHCPMRTVADVAAVAYNLAVYDKDYGGWQLVAGTSASAPLIAGIYALAGNAAKVKPGYEYAHAAALYNITVGNNDVINGTGGATCGYDYLCVAGKGYNGPTGLGTPDGVGAF